MKIAVLTLYENNNNYGGILQAYALSHYLNTIGYECDVIRYTGHTNPIYKNKFEMSKQYSKGEILKKIFERFSVKFDLIGKHILKEKDVKFAEFKKANISDSDIIYNDDNLFELNSIYDVFISGSDQVWNPNAVRYGFLQSFVSENKIKISYAASFGREKVSTFEKDVLVSYINKFDLVSVREATGFDILKSDIKNVRKVCDPIFLLNNFEWKNIIGKRLCKDRYVICYFFRKSKKIRDKLNIYCKKKKMKLLYLPYSKNNFKINDFFGKGTKMISCGPADFLSLIYYADYVFTDSFHATAFSILFNKEFWVFKRSKSSKVSMNSRLTDLLKNYELENRLVDSMDVNNIDEKINFKKCNEINTENSASGKIFLTKALKLRKIRVNVNQFLECVACSSCVNKCPQKCVRLVRNSFGKINPKVEMGSCTKCGICLISCPILSGNSLNYPIKSFGLKNKDVSILRSSSSGGVFADIARDIIRKNGIVYGCAFINLKTRHIRITNEKDIKKLLLAKYIQSDMSNIFPSILSDLIGNHLVLFSGTPCQVAGLKKFLKRDFKNLLTVDLVCHGVPAQALFDCYIKNKQKEYISKIINFDFRTKDKNQRFLMKIYFENGQVKYINGLKDSYYLSYINNLSLIEGCYHCKFTSLYRSGDITLGDFWGIEKFDYKFADKNGNSLVTVNTNKGDKYFNEIISDFNLITLDVKELVNHNISFKRPATNISYENRLIYSTLNDGEYEKDKIKSPLNKRILAKSPYFICKLIKKIRQ